MRPAAVLFDCDGVIVDSEPTTDRVIAANLTRHGLPMDPDGVRSLFRGGTMFGVADAARTRGANLGEGWVDAVYAEVFDALAAGTPLIEGITGVLDALDAAAIPYAVGSNGPHRKMAITLGQHPALHDRLRGRIYSREDVARPKPAADLYLYAANRIGAEPSRCIVIEDSATGARAARAAGMRCLGYAPHDDGAALAAVGARPFRHMDELPALLGL
ncbi:HAD family hydrolase [Albidovulum sp.]|uniref:HAD family hydrolase n=1 Tax=Albidovulum sp. TaxID=1872424 RepID=UPI001DD818FD|nr:HAD-IA family hydrolase [Paracoccaceae bacterium]MCB2138972.1 HAD-IA family hydrolase [Paracoccaceae bacterium]MCP5354343.1 HAD-IA family hydrolase [Paracoccaceae bacterium]MCP5375920.1 HAD-IA family hydrolase [Paracoccaceae bacterium]